MAKVKHAKIVKFLNFEEMKQLLAYVKKYYFVVFRKKDEFEPFKIYAFVEDLRVNLKITLKVGGKAFTAVFKKDSETVNQRITGLDGYRILSQYWKVPHIEEPSKCGSAIPFLYFNSKYEGKRVKAWCYDKRSAYASAMLGDMPDTAKGPSGKLRKVKSNEIGFIELSDSDPHILIPKNDLVMVGPGEYADIIFERMESPFKRFVTVWYKRKLDAKTPKEKQKAKAVLNYPIGYMQLVNPYIRATIVTRCNNDIQSKVDKNTLFCNTDSIVSLVPRPDLKLGFEVGDWQLEHQGDFAFIGFNYQWNLEVPTYRGICKAWFKKGWDLLVDPLPTPRNLFELDHTTLELRRIEYEIPQEEE